MNQDIFKKLKALISDKTGIEVEEIHENSYFEDDLNIGEMELVEILTEVDDTYNIDVIGEKDNIETVQDLIDLIIEYTE